MTENDNINQAVNLIKAGRREEARALIEDVLDQKPDDPRAWAVLYQLTDTYDEKVFALKQVLRWKPEDTWATQNLAQLDDKEALQRAIQHAKEGRREKALSLVDQVLSHDSENAGAWFLKAKYAKNPESAVKSLNQVLRISPRDKRAKKQLSRLQEQQVTGKKKLTPTKIMLGLAGISIIMGLCVTFGMPAFRELFPAGSGTDGDILGEVVDLPMTSCADLIERALSLTEGNCQKIGSNEVCYGNYDVYAEMKPGFSERFTHVGDRFPIGGFTKLQASPINLDKDVWGIALIKLQANMPGTVPGQNVTFMVFGDTEVNNTSGDMSAFYFSTGFTGVTCDEVPFDGLLIETPEGAGIVFRANGVDFVLQGDAILQAEGGEMTISMVNGTGQITADGQVVELGPGTSSSVEVDEDMEATGGPSDPEPLSDEEVVLACELFGIGCPEEEATVSPTNTPASGLPTNTPVPGTPGEPTNTSTPLPSDTPLPPVPTSTPAVTNTPPPTNTLIPTVTNTSSPMSCSAITVNPVSGAGGEFNITNNNAGDIVITQIKLTWPVGTNGIWKKVILGGTTIGNPNTDTSPATIILSASPIQRTIKGSKTEPMVFKFQNPTASTGYYVEITFDVGCTRSGTQ
jgi:hypothetical protein